MKQIWWYSDENNHNNDSKLKVKDKQNKNKTKYIVCLTKNGYSTLQQEHMQRIEWRDILKCHYTEWWIKVVPGTSEVNFPSNFYKAYKEVYQRTKELKNRREKTIHIRWLSEWMVSQTV